VDYRLGAKTGIDLLKDAMAMGCDEPIILLTGKGNYEVDNEAMKIGAVDYLVKTELNLESMERCIRYAMDRAANLKALRASERKYRGIYENMKDVIFIADVDWTIKDINPAVKDFLDYEPMMLIGTSFFKLLELEKRDVLINTLSNSSKPIHDFELNFVSNGGITFTGLLNIAMLQNNNGEYYLQGIIHDISSLKIIEKAHLQTEKLAAAGRLARTLAHEVRNPLTNIILSADQLRTDKQDEGNAVYLDMINRNSRRINDLITMLLDTSGPTDINLEKTAILDVMNGLLSSTNDSLNLKSIQLQLDVPEIPLFIHADKSKLILALKNIIVNAIDAMEQSKGLLQIKVVHSPAFINISIVDNGCGISAENLPRLFEPYFTRKSNGLGLGLTLTLNILQAHQAAIDVQSSLNVGTRFNIQIPRLNPDSH
jgi:PAS domain S-box-containing protein